MRSIKKKRNYSLKIRSKALKQLKKLKNSEKTHFYVILVTGTPGTGKSSIARFLARTLTFHYVNCYQMIKKHHLYSSFDKKDKCFVVDTSVLNRAVLQEIRALKARNGLKGAVVDSHLSHFLPGRYADLCIVCECSLPVLKKRLEKRGYSSQKVRENLDCEIFETSLCEARENHKVFVVDTSKGMLALKKALIGVKKELSF